MLKLITASPPLKLNARKAVFFITNNPELNGRDLSVLKANQERGTAKINENGQINNEVNNALITALITESEGKRE